MKAHLINYWMTLLHQSKKLTGKQVFPQKKKKKTKKKTWYNPVPGPLPQLKKKQAHLHGPTVTWNKNELMLQKINQKMDSTFPHWESQRTTNGGGTSLYNRWVVFELVSAVMFQTSFLTSFLRCHEDLPNLPG